MNINLQCLQAAVKNLPSPSERGERYSIPLPNRIIQVLTPSTEECVNNEEQNVLTLVAERYCSYDNCWLEWELLV